MVNNNIKKEIQITNHAFKGETISEILSEARDKLAQLPNTMNEAKKESKAKIKEGKRLLKEAKLLEKARKKKGQDINVVLEQQLDTSVTNDVVLKRLEIAFDKVIENRQNAEVQALTETLKRAEIEKKLELLKVQARVLSKLSKKDIELTNKLLKSTSDAKDAKALEIELKNSKYLRSILVDTYSEADKLNARFEDEIYLRKVNLSNIISSEDSENITRIEDLKQRMILEAEENYKTECNAIMTNSNDDITSKMRAKLLKEAENKLKKEMIITNGTAKNLLTNFALDKLEAARETVVGDMMTKKTILLEKIFYIIELERFRAARDHRAALAKIQEEKDRAIFAIIEDLSIPEEKKELAINQIIQKKQLELDALVAKFNDAEKVRNAEIKKRIKNVFNEIIVIQNNIDKLKHQVIASTGKDGKALDALIHNTENQDAAVLNIELENLRKEHELENNKHVQEIRVLVKKKTAIIDAVYDQIRDLNHEFANETNPVVKTIQNNNDVAKAQDKIVIAKEAAIQENKESLDLLREKLISNAIANGQISEDFTEHRNSIIEKEKNIFATKEQEMSAKYNDEEVYLQAKNTTQNAKVDYFIENLLSLAYIDELDALEAELSALEAKKQEEFLMSERELCLLEEHYEKEIELLRKESEELSKLLNENEKQLNAEAAVLEDETSKAKH